MNIINKGVILIAYSFILVVMYIVTSSPFEEIVASLETAGAGIPEMAYPGTMVRIAYNLCFAIAGLIPVIWFIASVFQDEPDWYYRS